MSKLPSVKHKQPCRECPFRRKAAAGWLGGGTVQQWVSDLTFGDVAFVCHMAAAKDKMHYCAGSMIHKNNQLKQPRDPVMARHQDQYGTDREDVFTWVSEFEAHHANGLLAEKGK